LARQSKANHFNRDEVPLTGMLAEFRTALREEIEAARRREASSAVSLVNGRRIAQIGKQYQYLFDVESMLNLPSGETPGDLYVKGRAPLEVMIISVDGMAVTLSVPEDLGTFVPTARLQSNLAQLMRKLIERIECLAGKPNPAGDRIMGNAPVSGELDTSRFNGELNESQTNAVASALGRNATFIWGPPGTGKTHVIGTIGEQLYRRDRSVLMVSHTNIAVDQAILRIANRLDQKDLEKGLVLRAGESKDPELNSRKELLLETHVERRSQELAGERDALSAELEQLTEQVLKLSRSIGICEWVKEAGKDISEMSEWLSDLHKTEESWDSTKNQLRKLQSNTDYLLSAAQSAEEMRGHLAGISKLNSRIKAIDERLAQASALIENCEAEISKAESILEEASSVSWLTRKWRGLPSPEDVQREINSLNSQLAEHKSVASEAADKLGKARGLKMALEAKLQAFREKHFAEPDEILQLAKRHQAELASLSYRCEQQKKEALEDRHKLEELLRDRLSALREWELTTRPSGTAEGMLEAVSEAYEAAVSEIRNVPLEELRTERDQLNERIVKIEGRILRIEEQLKKIKEIIISEAIVVATTLTRAYLWDSIQARRFDTVILDEASMAPIPALWVAASLADANVIVVGDYKQLPPIVLSNNDIAMEWLGRDIFEEVGLNDYSDDAERLITLKTQYRMHPEISVISNELIYAGRLRDGEKTLNDEADEKLLTWYRQDWGHDRPVLMVDTEKTNAWVTSVARGSWASRLNFLSATICVDIAEQLLRNDRPEAQAGDKPRILIVCLYRPHAKLLELLIRTNKLDNEVRAGTAHNFQGSEADVVIFDLVNDEPHFRVGIFIPALDDTTKRLLNVALTRAKRRLVIVGDFEYCKKLSKKAFVGKEFIPFLQDRYGCVDALEVVPSGLAGRAAEAQTRVLGGDIEPDADRLVVTQTHFYPMLVGDLKRAANRIIIYSAFITSNRLAQLEPAIKAARERGVVVYIVTKTQQERGKRELAQYRMLENTLTEWGVVVIHKKGMHEKLVFIDNRIVWMGSLNPLSFSNTQEIMERRANRIVFDDFFKSLRLRELVDEYDGGIPECPFCGNEMVASEGKDDPYYWRCVMKDCYSRSIDDPPLLLEDGLVPCANCGEKVEYGYWGGKPHWRCKKNRQHRQKVAKTHLRLPKMRKLIPKAELRTLDRIFGLEEPVVRPQSELGSGPLFDQQVT